MHSECFIPGRDASRDSSNATMQSRLVAPGLHVEERACCGQSVPGLDLAGCGMHRRLLAGYAALPLGALPG